MFRKVVVGGTFDRLHRGHKSILDTAFGLSDDVVIGLTSDEFASRFRSTKTLAYKTRKQNLEGYIKDFGKSYKIIEINDSYGVATIDDRIDCIVVSEETLLRGEEINTIRFKKGLKKLVIVVVPLVVGSDGKPISSDRINRGETDEEGN